MRYDPSEIRLVTKVAKLYYEKEMTQKEIAKSLGISQVTVSRLLRRAQEMNIVRTTVVSPAGAFAYLEDQLEKKYGLQQAIVAEATRNSEEAIMRAIGSAAAYFVESTLKSNEVVGLSSWSSSLLSMVDQMHPVRQINGCTVVQIQGGLGNPSAAKHAHHLVSRFAGMINAEVRFLPAPCIVGSSDAGNVLLLDPSIRQTMELFCGLTMALVGIGAIEPSDLFASSGNVYSDEDAEMLQAAGAVGDIAARFFDAKGEPVVEPLDGRVIGITLEELRNVPRSVGIAGGKRKLTAIRGALLGRLINILVTDQYTAESLMRMPLQPKVRETQHADDADA